MKFLEIKNFRSGQSSKGVNYILDTRWSSDLL